MARFEMARFEMARFEVARLGHGTVDGVRPGEAMARSTRQDAGE